jgi:hypothetical protein
MNVKRRIELPNLFCFENGRQVRNVKDWRARRKELLKLILDIEYGQLPPVPSRTEGMELHSHIISELIGARHTQYRLITGRKRSVQFLLNVLVPPGGGPFPVVLTGDDCWRDVADNIARKVLKRKYILAEFNRAEIVPDHFQSVRGTGLRCVYPKGTYGALAAWAWGFHRCVDFLMTLPCVDTTRIAVTGHSRGGKAALLAGATDERIALTAPNNSGCGGAGCFRLQGPGSETLADILRSYPHWFSCRLKAFAGKEYLLPFDQHSLKALVAPRALLSTEALNDLWANPSGTLQTYIAAHEIYRFLGAEDRIGIWYREGGHEHGPADWSALLDFMDWQFHGKKPRRRFNVNPYRNLPGAFSRSAPRAV